MHNQTNPHEHPAHTEGHPVKGESHYDFVMNIFTLGRARRLRAMTVEQAGLKPGEAVLDVGCGTGGVTIPAKKAVGEKGKAAGIDPSAEMIAAARRKAERAGLDIDFQVGVIESLAFPDDTFDAVTSSLMMHHLPGDLQTRGLAEIKRVLKPGGRLLIADMRRPSDSFFARYLTLNGIYNALRGGHIQETSIEDLPAVLAGAGFEGVELLDARFQNIGFVRGRKPVAAYP